MTDPLAPDVLAEGERLVTAAGGARVGAGRPMTDPAAIRAEGRRLLADFYAIGPEDDGFRQDKLTDFLFDHLDVLLADPAQILVVDLGEKP